MGAAATTSADGSTNPCCIGSPRSRLEIEEMPLPTEAPPVRAQEMPSEFEDRWNAQYDHRTARDSVPVEQWRLWE